MDFKTNDNKNFNKYKLYVFVTYVTELSVEFLYTCNYRKRKKLGGF